MKNLLDVADNLERAADAVGLEAMQGRGKDGEPLNAEQLSKLLQSLMEGVQLTQRVLDQVHSQPASQRTLTWWQLALFSHARARAGLAPSSMGSLCLTYAVAA